ncbi:MAG: DNA-processing protein DprA [Mycoplasmataceae bacterium]|nr:DNA-processing protein DprA [Mycoplasmataceae bacterium]
MNIILIFFTIKYKGDWDKIYRALENKEKVSLTEINELEKKMKDEEWKILTIIDREYPKQLKEAYKPPFVLWLKGDEKLLDNPIINVTGNQIDSKAIERIETFVSEVEKNHTIISSAFKGVDEKVLANSKNGKIIVLANGFNNPYINYKITDKDLLISEYEPDVKMSKGRLRARNRIVAAFSKSLILISSLKDGPINNLITNYLNIGKDVYCFPGDGDDEDGNSELIKQGASLITGIKDIAS